MTTGANTASLREGQQTYKYTTKKDYTTRHSGAPKFSLAKEAQLLSLVEQGGRGLLQSLLTQHKLLFPPKRKVHPHRGQFVDSLALQCRRMKRRFGCRRGGARKLLRSRRSGENMTGGCLRPFSRTSRRRC
jgi:hypothetical protein